MEKQNTNSFTVQSVQSNLDTAICLIPSVPANANSDSQNLFIRYETEKLGFEWRTQNKPLPEYLLGNLEFLIKEYPNRDIPGGDKPSSSSSNKEKLFDTKG